MPTIANSRGSKHLTGAACFKYGVPATFTGPGTHLI
jgi:hypothetical protein